jgi:hypothetical protein
VRCTGPMLSCWRRTALRGGCRVFRGDRFDVHAAVGNGKHHQEHAAGHIRHKLCVYSSLNRARNRNHSTSFCVGYRNIANAV